MHLAAAQIEIDAVQRNHAGKPLGHFGEFEKQLAVSRAASSGPRRVATTAISEVIANLSVSAVRPIKAP